MTHGFDDEGRKYDGAGALSDWWTKADADKFDAQAKTLNAQFDTYEPFPGVHVKGDQTTGENIADLGGILIALDAYHNSLHGQPAPVIDGLSGDQRLFLGWVQIWRGKVRDNQAIMWIKTDPHSPDRFRGLLPERNIGAFYEAFDVKPGDKMYLPPQRRVSLW
jgi:putative endopeptidase